MSRFITVLISLVSCAALSVLAQDVEFKGATLSFNQAHYSIDLGVPPGWSVSPHRSRNAQGLTRSEPGDSGRWEASIRIFVEPRLDEQDALARVKGYAAQPGSVDKRFIEIGGWPAVQITRREAQAAPDNAPPLEAAELLKVYTYIAAGSTLVTVAGSTRTDARPGLVTEIRDVAASLSFPTRGNPADVKQAIDMLQSTGSTKTKPDQKTKADTSARRVTVETTPVEITAETGANDRINTSGFGELEIATSPDGTHVVVALQGRRWVSSNDGGATFPNSGRVGVGNGDPSAAWGQSGKFYMAFIDNSGNCGSGYLNPVVAPGPAPDGIDCTGIARSDDNGVTFNTNTVNPAVVCIGRAAAGDPDNPGECFPDQEHIAADRWNAGDTPGDDQVYSTWRNFMPGSQDAGLVCSSDSGVTWSVPFDIGTPETFPRITVGPDGFVYVATLSDWDYHLYKFTSCVDGLTLVPGFPVTVGTIDFFQCPFAGHDRCDQNPTSQTVVVDETDPNHVYYAYVDDRGNGDSGDSDIIVRDSLDGGLNWNIIGRVARANENVGARRIMPWLCTTSGSAVVTWYEQRGALPTDTTDYFGARVGLDELGDLVPMEEFVLSEVSDNWCDIGWQNPTRWGYTDTQISNPAEACPDQPQLAGQCGDGDDPNDTPDSGIRCDFSDDDGVTFTNCLQADSSPSGHDEKCLTGGGVPKYGDYNGNACAGGKLFAAWASANAPDGLPGPDTATNPGVLFDVINLDNLGVPVITIPGNVHFGDICPGDTQRFETLEVCNTGSANLQVDVIASDNPDFEVTVPSSGYPVTISPDFCFPFEVAYAPGAEPPTATLTVPSNDPDRPTVAVTADATAGAAQISTFIANSGDFGEICAGLFGDLDLTVQNNGSCALQIDSAALSGTDQADFVLPDGSVAGSIIEPGNSLLVPVRFAPSAFGDPTPRTASVDINSSTAGGDPLALNQTPVSGTAPPPDINVAIANAGNFGAVCKDDFADLDLTLFNQGRCDLTISDINSFKLEVALPESLQLPLILSHDAEFTLPLRYSPATCDDTPFDSAIQVLSDSPGEEDLQIGISGSSPCPNLVIDAGGLTGAFAFPATVVDSTGLLGCFNDRATNLRNTGACPLTISDISAAGDDFTVMDPQVFPIVLPPGEETLTVTVRFTPQSGGDPLLPEETLGTLTVVSDDPDASGEAPLCGEGVVQSGIRTLVTDITTGVPAIVDSVDSMTVRTRGKKTPSPINLRFTDVEPGYATVCGNDVYWHLDLETLPATETTGSKGGKSQYETYAKEGNLQDSRSFGLDQCEFSEFELQLKSSDGGGGGSCLLKDKGEACSSAAECCSGKCTGKAGAKACR